MDMRDDLARLRGQELQADAARRRLVREARAGTRRSRRRSPLRMAVGTGLVRAGLRLGGEAPVSAALGTFGR